MKALYQALYISLLLFTCLSCGVDDASLSEGFLIQPGDIIISDNANNSVYHYDSTGKFIGILFTAQTGEVTYGLSWNHLTNEIYISIDGADRIAAVKAIDKSIVDPQIATTTLNGVLRAVAVLSDGETIVTESNNIERFDRTNNRVVSAVWPQIGVGTGPYDINPTVDGGYIISFFNSSRIDIHNADTTLRFRTLSSVPGTVRNYGTIEMSNGNIATVWNGATDTVIIYSPDLTTEILTYANPSILTDPRSIVQAANGNLLIVDGTLDHIIEITQSGDLVRTFPFLGGSAWDMLVIPNF